MLEYLLQGAAVVPPEWGLFLGESYRMHPALCAWVSEAIYDGSLTAHASCDRQELLLGDGCHPALVPHGLKFREVAHEGCSQRSDEEVAEVAAIWHDLMRQCWRDRRAGSGRSRSRTCWWWRPGTCRSTHCEPPYRPRRGWARWTGSRAGGGRGTGVHGDLGRRRHPARHPFLFSRERLNVAVSRRIACRGAGQPQAAGSALCHRGGPQAGEYPLPRSRGRAMSRICIFRNSHWRKSGGVVVQQGNRSYLARRWSLTADLMRTATIARDLGSLCHQGRKNRHPHPSER
ncbi:AAA domain-containing protein [Roseomonas sp. FDAARGOS_362]|uniref:AAA domain-containing protein n=1 Tax=Roseomonas sp. FDAARGOS_362 TaxID=2018065 RepID=UPI003511ADFA